MLRKSRGFTLIELLVVIAIIAILAAILFPVFARARAKAYQTQDLSNIKNMATATKIYTSDYGMHFWPDPDWCVENYLIKGGYVTDYQVVRSPYVNGKAYEYSFQFNGCYEYDGQNACQSWGGLSWKHYCSSQNPTTYYIGANETWIEDPAQTVMWLDGNYYGPDGTDGAKYSWMGVEARYTYNQCKGCRSFADSNNQYNCLVYRHNDGMNVAWVDGHVSWLKRDTKAPQYNMGLQRDVDGCDDYTGADTMWDLGPKTRELYERLWGVGNADCPGETQIPARPCVY